MKDTLFVLLTLVLFSCAGEKSKKYVIENKFPVNIIDKAVVVSRDDVAKYLTIPEGKVVLVQDETGSYLSSQCDDIDGDGNWDELAFLVDLTANEKKSVLFVAVDKSDVPEFPVRTNIRFGDIKYPYKELFTAVRLKSNDTKISQAAFQMEGPVWENDIIAFRNYFDARNGMDIYGKRTPEMSMDSIGLPGKPSYHELADWGMDILKVANSLGAGAIGMQIGDSLYRIGPSGEGEYRFITEGPVRAMFDLTFDNVKMADRTYSIKHRISIYAGDHFYRSKVTVKGLKGDEKLITGIVDHDTKLVGGEYEGMKYFFTLGPQAFLHEYLGMAVLADKNAVAGTFDAPETGDGITMTHVVSLNIKDGKPVEFEFLAVWELQDVKIKDQGYFEGLIKNSILKLK